ncbi:MAG: hypothetical protein V3U33_07800 [candidate division NC10 bacterium]
MWEQIGKAEVEARVRPRKYAELREYLRQEYGAGTEPAAFLLEAGLAGESPRTLVRRALAWAVRAVAGSNGAKAKTSERTLE